ncbi:MAG: hypothetical protein HZA50_13360 [Planctomycetes bacterium]|nr:hypothetical protein [Planctomycetota bacterium]
MNGNGTNGRAMKDRLLGRILVQMGAVGFDHVHTALQEQGKKGGPIGDVMINLGIIDRHTRDIALAFQRGMKYMDVSRIGIPGKLLEMVPAQMAWSCRILPLGKDKSIGKLLVAFDSPDGLAQIDKLESRFNAPIQPVFTLPGQMSQALSRFYGLPDSAAPDVNGASGGRARSNCDTHAAGLKKMICKSCGIELTMAKGVDKPPGRCVNCMGELVQSAPEETIVKWLNPGWA